MITSGVYEFSKVSAPVSVYRKYKFISYMKALHKGLFRRVGFRV